MPVTDAQRLVAFQGLRGNTCRCGLKKPQGHPFCAACLAALAPELRTALVEHLISNYDDRYMECVAALTTFTREMSAE